jgi:glycosyltransferase involved in cell wall biosynthesis
MKILWVTGSKIVGGAERVTFQVLGELRRRGHDISALYRYSPDFEQKLLAEKIRPQPANLGGSLNLPASLEIKRGFSKLRPHIALVTTSDEWVWASLVPRKRYGTRLVLVRHMALALPAKVRWLANLRADAVVAVSETARATLQLKPGIEPARLFVIANPVRFPIRDSPPSPIMRSECRRALGLPIEGRWIGFFGGADPQKGIRDVLQALLRVRDELDNCNLLVCGRAARDSRFPTVRRLAAEYGLGDNSVRYLGQIDEVDKAITACDAVAIATHASLSEAAPLAALEAMACGTPIAGYAVGGIREVLGDGRAGALAAPDQPEDLAKQLARILGDQDFATRLALSALERARLCFAPELAADRYESLFAQLCSPRGVAGSDATGP